MSTVYVDLNLATGDNDGSSWANAYRTWAGMVSALAGTLTDDLDIYFRADGTVDEQCTIDDGDGWINDSGYTIRVIGDTENDSIMYRSVAYADVFYTDINDVEIHNVIATGGRDGFAFLGAGNIAYNCQSIGCGSDGFYKSGDAGSPGEVYLYYCNAVDCGAYGLNLSDYRYLTAINCYFGGNSSGDILVGGGSASLTLTTCLTSDGSQSTSTAAYSTDNFTNVSSGSEDLHLVSGSDLIDGGTVISGFTDDADGNARGSSPDIGAYEYVSSGGTTYNVTCADGISLSDSASRSAVFNCGCSDGISLSDGDGVAVDFIAQLSDGIKLSDSAGAAAFLAVLCGDGVKLSDAASTGAIISAMLSDGISLSDSAGASAIFSALCADGIKLSDSVTAAAIFVAQLMDGIKLSDTATTESVSIINVTCSDGIVLADGISAKYIANVVCVDGITLSDFLTATAIYNATCSDGVKLSDLVIDSTELAAGKVVIRASVTGLTISGEAIPLTIKLGSIKLLEIKGENL